MRLHLFYEGHLKIENKNHGEPGFSIYGLPSYFHFGATIFYEACFIRMKMFLARSYIGCARKMWRNLVYS